MAQIIVHFAKTGPIDLGVVAPGIKASGQETTEYALEVSPPASWTADDIKHLVNTMAKIAGELTPGRTFSVDKLSKVRTSRSSCF